MLVKFNTDGRSTAISRMSLQWRVEKRIMIPFRAQNCATVSTNLKNKGIYSFKHGFISLK